MGVLLAWCSMPNGLHIRMFGNSGRFNRVVNTIPDDAWRDGSGMLPPGIPMSQPKRTDLYLDRDVDDYPDGSMHERYVRCSGSRSGPHHGVGEEHSDAQCLCTHDPYCVAGI